MSGCRWRCHARTRSPLLALVAAGVLLLSGCAGPVRVGIPDAAPDVGCEALDERWHAAVEAEGVRDVQAAAIAGWPFLRVNREVEARARTPSPGVARPGWLLDAAALDARARSFEFANLSPAGRRAVGEDALVLADECRLALLESLSTPAARSPLRQAARVADAYSPTARGVGLYPLVSFAFLAGVAELHRRFEGVFAQPLPGLPVSGRLTRYVPAPAAEGADGLRALIARHAPVWEVDVASEDDRIGHPGWPVAADPHSAVPIVDTTRPVAFTHVGRGTFHGEPVLGLSYVIWFPARPPAGPLDLLAGHLDGITWRVILDGQGNVLAHDVMHNCGCYHMVLPGERIRRGPPRQRHEEPILVPQASPVGDGRVVLRLAHRTHHLQRAYRVDGTVDGLRYVLRDYDDLRSLPRPDGQRRSLFGPRGLVRGSERAERYLFWPMGVASAGAMRQWGHHAVAFVGRRHFDDPSLLERHFRLR